MSESEFELIEGGSNLFRDFGDPEADLKHAKAVLAARIIMTLDERGLSVRKAAATTLYAAADFSRVRNADLGRFTMDRLMKMLAALDGDLHITVHIHADAEDKLGMTNKWRQLSRVTKRKERRLSVLGSHPSRRLIKQDSSLTTARSIGPEPPRIRVLRRQKGAAHAGPTGRAVSATLRVPAKPKSRSASPAQRRRSPSRRQSAPPRPFAKRALS